MRCYWVEKNESGKVTHQLAEKPFEVLESQRMDAQEKHVRIRVGFSSLNYKDAMAATGHTGIVRNFPHIPGIDAAGTVIESDDDRFIAGDSVLVTGYELGVNHFGGWAEEVYVPSGWVVTCPGTLSAYEAMSLGTAGFTAAQCVSALQSHAITPESGRVVVTGATGGVSTIAISILIKLGYDVVAVTGKLSQHEKLRSRGVAEVLTRDQFIDDSSKPLLKGNYAAAVDTVGGKFLETILKSISYRGCVTACGMTGGTEIHCTVFPFLLRGITLCGIDSAMCPMPSRLQIWQRLANDWKPDDLQTMTTTTSLDEIDFWVDRLLKGEVAGRVVVEIP